MYKDQRVVEGLEGAVDARSEYVGSYAGSSQVGSYDRPLVRGSSASVRRRSPSPTAMSSVSSAATTIGRPAAAPRPPTAPSAYSSASTSSPQQGQHRRPQTAHGHGQRAVVLETVLTEPISARPASAGAQAGASVVRQLSLGVPLSQVDPLLDVGAGDEPPEETGAPEVVLRSRDVSYREDAQAHEPGLVSAFPGRRYARAYNAELRKFLVSLYPNLAPSGRYEVGLLDRWYTDIVDSATARYEAVRRDVGAEATRAVEEKRARFLYMNEIAAVSQVALVELVRQVTVHMMERGNLLTKVWNNSVRMMQLEAPVLIDPEDHHDLKRRYAALLDEVEQLRKKNAEYLRDVRRVRDISERREAADRLTMDRLEAEILRLHAMLDQVDELRKLVPEMLEAQYQRFLASHASDKQRNPDAIPFIVTTNTQVAEWETSLEILVDYFSHLDPDKIPESMRANRRVKFGKDVGCQVYVRGAKRDVDAEEEAAIQARIDAAVKQAFEDYRGALVAVECQTDPWEPYHAREPTPPPAAEDPPEKKKKKKAEPEVVPDALSLLLAKSAKGLGRKKPPAGVAKMIVQIYHDFVDLSRTDKTVRAKSWVQFTYEWFLKKYGLRELAESNLIDFFQSVESYRDDPSCGVDRRCRTFLRWLGSDSASKRTVADLAAAMQLVVAVKESPSPSTSFTAETSVVFVNAEFAQAVTRKLLRDQVLPTPAFALAHFKDDKPLLATSAAAGTATSIPVPQLDEETLSRYAKDLGDKLLKITRTIPPDVKKVWGAAAPKTVVDYDSLVSLWISLRRYASRDFSVEFSDLFDRVDVDHDETVSFEKLQALMHNLDSTISETVVLKMYQDGIRLSELEDVVTKPVFCKLAARYNLVPWRPDIDEGVTFLKNSKASEELFTQLEALWKTTEASVRADIAEIRTNESNAGVAGPGGAAGAGDDAKMSATGAPVGRARRGAVTNEAPGRFHKVEAALNNFLDHLGTREDPEAAWESYRTLMSVVKERPPIQPADLVAMLRKVTFFKDTTEEFLLELVKAFKQARFNAGEMLMYAGETGREMYLITNGEVEILAGDDSRVVAELTLGSFFGEIALLKNSKRTASARTKTACDMCILFKKDFQSLLQRFPDMRDKIWEAASEKVLKLEEAIFNRGVVSKVPLFAGTPEGFIRALVDGMHPRMFAADEVIIRQGDVGEEMFILNEGVCDVVVDSGSGPKAVAQIAAGNVFGETALVKNEARSASIIARTSVVACRLGKQDFDNILTSWPAIRKKFTELVLKNMKASSKAKGKD